MPNPDIRAQAIVNMLQLQRNTALDNCATLAAELEATKEELKVAKAEVEHLHTQLDAGVKDNYSKYTDMIPVAKE